MKWKQIQSLNENGEKSIDLDLEKKSKTQKVILKKTIWAIILSNFFQLSLHLFLKEPPPPKEKKEKNTIEKGFVIIDLSPQLFVPPHSSGKRTVSLVSKDQKDIIKKAYLYPVPSSKHWDQNRRVQLEVPEKSLRKIIKRKSDWEVYPFSKKIAKKKLKKILKKNPYEIIF